MYNTAVKYFEMENIVAKSTLWAQSFVLSILIYSLLDCGLHNYLWGVPKCKFPAFRIYTYFAKRRTMWLAISCISHNSKEVSSLHICWKSFLVGHVTCRGMQAHIHLITHTCCAFSLDEVWDRVLQKTYLRERSMRLRKRYNWINSYAAVSRFYLGRSRITGVYNQWSCFWWRHRIMYWKGNFKDADCLINTRSNYILISLTTINTHYDLYVSSACLSTYNACCLGIPECGPLELLPVAGLSNPGWLVCLQCMFEHI